MPLLFTIHNGCAYIIHVYMYIYCTKSIAPICYLYKQVTLSTLSDWCKIYQKMYNHVHRCDRTLLSIMVFYAKYLAKCTTMFIGVVEHFFLSWYLKDQDQFWWMVMPEKKAVTGGHVVRAGVSVTWNVLPWSGGREFESRLGRMECAQVGSCYITAVWQFRAVCPQAKACNTLPLHCAPQPICFYYILSCQKKSL